MPARLALINRFLEGWSAYFALAEMPSVFDEFDEWLRRRLRQVRWMSVVFGSTGEPPDADPHIRWRGRGRSNTGPYPIGGNPAPAGV